MDVIKVQTTVEVSPERIEDLLCSAWEGGSHEWCAATLEVEGEDVTYTWQHASRGGRFTIRLRHSRGRWLDRDAEDGEVLGTLDGEALARGLQVLAEKYPRHFNDFLHENEDAETGDVFLQCAVMGEVVYG